MDAVYETIERITGTDLDAIQRHEVLTAIRSFSAPSQIWDREQLDSFIRAGGGWVRDPADCPWNDAGDE